VFRKIERNRHGAFQEDPFVDFEAAQSFSGTKARLLPQQRTRHGALQKATLYLYRKGLRSFEFHEWVFLEGSMTVTLNFAENTLSVTQYATL